MCTKKIILILLITFNSWSTVNGEVEQNKYIAFGDSITKGYNSSDGRGYPQKLENTLNIRIGPSTVVNEGINGERTFGGLERIDDVLHTYNAKFILIMEGTNDVNDISAVCSTETIIFNLEQMIDKAVKFGTTPLIATLPPRKDDLDDRVKKDVNPAISRLAQEKGITLVDQYTKMANNKDAYMSDCLHPNDAGYELIAENWFIGINNILNPQEDHNGGCGVVPPIYRKNNSKGFYNNLCPLWILLILTLFLKRLYKLRLLKKV